MAEALGSEVKEVTPSKVKEEMVSVLKSTKQLYKMLGIVQT